MTITARFTRQRADQPRRALPVTRRFLVRLLLLAPIAATLTACGTGPSQADAMFSPGCHVVRNHAALHAYEARGFHATKFDGGWTLC